MAVDKISVNGLSWSYRSGPVLDDLSAGFPERSLNCVIGPNGSGKTTLLKCMLRLLDTPAGKVFYEGRDLHSFSRKSLARIGAYVPQNFSIRFDYTVREIVESGRYPHLHRLKGMQAADKAIADRAIERAELSGLAGKPVTSLSGGEAQRVFLARALTQGASVIFLDEPTSHLDIHHQIGIFRLLKDLIKNEGLTVVAVVHNLDFVFAYADWALILDKGKVHAAGVPSRIIDSETCRTVFGIEADIKKDSASGRHLLVPRFR